MKKILIVALVILLGQSYYATEAYPCNGCNEAQYKQVAKQHEGPVYVYDLEYNNLRRYSVVQVRECEIFIGFCWVIDEVVAEQVDSNVQEDFDIVYQFYKDSDDQDSVRIDVVATEFTPSSIINQYTAYDMFLSGQDRNVMSEFIRNELTSLVQNNTVAENVLKVLTEVAANFVGLDPKMIIVVTFKDGSKAVFKIDQSSNGLNPELDRENEENTDSDYNPILNSSDGVTDAGTYDFVYNNNQNINRFLQAAEIYGIRITNSNSNSPRFVCKWDPDSQTLTCSRQDPK